MNTMEIDIDTLKYEFDGVIQFWKSRFTLIKLGVSPFWSVGSKRRTIFWNMLMALPVLFGILQPLFMSTIHPFDPSKFFDLALNLLEANTIYNGIRWFLASYLNPDDEFQRIRYKSLVLGLLAVVLIFCKLDGQI